MHGAHVQALQRLRDSARNHFDTAVPNFATISGLMNTIQEHSTQKEPKEKTHNEPPVYRMSIKVALGQLRQLGPGFMSLGDMVIKYDDTQLCLLVMAVPTLLVSHR